MQFLNTRSHKGEKEKEKVPDKDAVSVSDIKDTVPEGDLSLMDRTKRQARAAREQHKKKTNAILSTEEEVLDLEEVVLQTRERVKATKAARSRAEALRRELQDLEEEEQSVLLSDEDASPAVPVVPVPAPAPVPVPDPADPGAFLAASLQSAV